MIPSPDQTLPRRGFLKTSALAAGILAAPSILRARQDGSTPLQRLNVAVVGVGGRGRAAIDGFKGENFVAFADVDDRRAAETYNEHPDVPRFRDYRRMFDQLGNRIDAVAIMTPDHMHFPIAMAAMALGKHVYVEKPLVRTADECRRLLEAARRARVKTQMGNQGHSNEGTRVLKEWYDAGVLGNVPTVWSWTDRPIWPQGRNAPNHENGAPAVPSELDWDLWLGVAAERAYDPAYLPFNWRGWWDFGTGALGDMACHIMDAAFFALNLGAPEWIEAVSTPVNDATAPTASMITYHFPARGGRGPVRYIWSDGRLLPPVPQVMELNRRLPDNGTLVFGDKATALIGTYGESVRIIPEARMRELAPGLPPKTLPRIEGGHFQDFIRACKGGPEACSNFEYAAPLTETVVLGNLAIRTRRRVAYDSAAMKADTPEADALLRSTYRPGWGV